MEYKFITSAELRKQLHVSASFLYVCRRRGDWKQGIHWVYLNPLNPRSGIRYNAFLCTHWLICNDAHMHEAAINNYLKTLTLKQPATTAK